VGGFDPRFTFQREDVDVAFSILHLGLFIGYCPDIQVLHLHRGNEHWDLLKNCCNRRFDPLLFKKHPELYRQWIKTPATPSITALLALHGLLIAGLCVGLATGLLIVGDLGYALVLSLRRNLPAGFHGGQIARDWLSYGVSPFVLFGALVYGSVKFKKFLVL
jgi:GT2 family glycosyltransferase